MVQLGEAEQWLLKGQGNANAVFAYVGSSPDLDCHVLRIRKATHASRPASAEVPKLEKFFWSPAISPSLSGAAERQAAYEDTVLRPLLGPQYIHRGRLCQLPPHFAAALSAQVAGACSSLSCQAWLLSDHTLFRRSLDSEAPRTGISAQRAEDSAKPARALHAAKPLEACEAVRQPGEVDQAGTLCVELKPKCGFLPTSALISPEHDVKRRVPRFQLHQLLKLEQGKIERLSAYNPLDLFSGVSQRMEAALAALLEEPQSNLRLFAGGAAVQLPPDGKLANAPVLQRFGGGPGLIRLLRAILLKEGVLERILAVQKMDVHDIEGIHPLLPSLLEMQASAQPLPDTLQRCQIDTPSEGASCASCFPLNSQHKAQAEPASFTSNHQKEHALPCSDLAASLAGVEQEPKEQLSEAAPAPHSKPEECAQGLASLAPSQEGDKRSEELRRLLSADWPAACAAMRGYLTAATAKDSSVMITLAPLTPAPAYQTASAGCSIPAETASGDQDWDVKATGCRQSKDAALQGCTASSAGPSVDDVGEGGKDIKSGQGCQTAGIGLPPVQEDADIGAVVQDCESGEWFKYKVAVVDLDLKPLSKVEQHFVLDQQILECALRAGVYR